MCVLSGRRERSCNVTNRYLPLLAAGASAAAMCSCPVDRPPDAFDPAVHEALFEYPDADKAPGDVGQLVKTGFKLHGRVIRAAQVGVVKKP